MGSIDPKLLDELAELEVNALLVGMRDPETMTNPAFLEKVRKFLQQNKLVTTPQTPGIIEVRKEFEKIPIFDNQ